MQALTFTQPTFSSDGFSSYVSSSATSKRWNPDDLETNFCSMNVGQSTEVSSNRYSVTVTDKKDQFVLSICVIYL